MPRDPRFDILFEPVKIGPVTAPNRFYQVPHCTGMGYQLPASLATMRGIKAEGGWGVVNTEYCSIHPSSDDIPAPFASLWDDDDTRNMTAMVEAVHVHGALAGVELWHGGLRSSNLQSRETGFGPQSLPVASDPWQCARMDLEDIRQLRRWHRDAALRAKAAGMDIVYVYAAHTYLLGQFLDIYVFQFWKRLTESKHLWLRATGSTVLSQIVDTVTINVMFWSWTAASDPASFLGKMLPRERWVWIFQKIAREYGIKVVVAVLLTPVVYALHAFIVRALRIEPEAHEPKTRANG